MEKRLNKLLKKKFLSWDELDEVAESTEVEKIENLGYSGQYYPKKWYVAHITNGEEYSVYID